MDYFISDMHFGHKNIIRYCDRPFKTVHEMNEVIVSRWNDTVTDGDRVFVIGDVFLMDPDDASHIIKSLNGYKILIMGNHDRSYKTMLSCGFDECHKTYDYKSSDGKKILLQHYPNPDIVLKEMGYSFQIHGHIHSKPLTRGLKVNVAVDLIDFKPISIDHIMQLGGFLHDKVDDEIFDVRVEDGQLMVKMKIDTRDFPGASSEIYRIMKNSWGK